MKIRKAVGIIILFVMTGFVGAQELPESSYWDDIELSDGQLLRGVVVDRVKGQAVIQLSTRDFISLPEDSVVRVTKGVARPSKKPAVSVAVGASVDLSLTTPATAEQKTLWATRWTTTVLEGGLAVIELVDGTRIEGRWVETDAGYAVLVLADGSVTGVSRAKIRRVSTGGTPVPELSTGPSGPDLLEPLVSAWNSTWTIVNQEPSGRDATPFRSLFLPTARTLPAGEFVLSQLDLVATQGTWGVTDELQIQLGATLPAYVIPQFGSLAQIGVQYALDLPSFEGGQWRVGVLNWFLVHQTARYEEENKASLGEARGYLLPGAVLSVQFGDWGLSATSGLWKGLQDGEFRLTAGASVVGALGAHWAVVGDWGGAWEFRTEPQQWYSGAWAFRYWNTGMTVDLGVQLGALLGKNVSWQRWGTWGETVSEYRSEWNRLIVLPVLHFSFRP